MCPEAAKPIRNISVKSKYEKKNIRSLKGSPLLHNHVASHKFLNSCYYKYYQGKKARSGLMPQSLVKSFSLWSQNLHGTQLFF